MKIALERLSHKYSPTDLEPIADGPRVVIGNPSDNPTIDGKEVKRLTLPQFNVIRALLNAGERGLSKDNLANKSSHGDAVRILKRIAESDPAWKEVIQFAGKPGGGYRILVESRRNLPKPPQVSRPAPTKRTKG